MKVIGMCGPKQSGKDTTASMMKKSIPGLENLALAGYLKDVCSAVFNVNREYFDHQKMKETLFPVVKLVEEKNLLQVLGLYATFLDDSSIWYGLPETLPSTIVRTPRELLQFIGTDILRTYRPDIHLDVAAKSASPSGSYVITDCRFQNEIKWVQRQGGKVFYIDRPEAEKRMFESSHISEKGIADLRFKCDYVIQNYGSLEELAINVKSALELMEG
jgi:hypothetical protein